MLWRIACTSAAGPIAACCQLHVHAVQMTTLLYKMIFSTITACVLQHLIACGVLWLLWLCCCSVLSNSYTIHGQYIIAAACVYYLVMII
jgi:hypothetical protein